MSTPSWFTFSNSKTLISLVSNGFNCLVEMAAALARPWLSMKLEGGLWKVFVGLVLNDKLLATDRESPTRRDSMSLGGVILRMKNECGRWIDDRKADVGVGDFYKWRTCRIWMENIRGLRRARSQVSETEMEISGGRDGGMDAVMSGVKHTAHLGPAASPSVAFRLRWEGRAWGLTWDELQVKLKR